MALDYRNEYQRYKHYYTYLGNLTSHPIFRAYFSVVVSIFTIALFVAFAIRPTIATIISLKKELSDKTELNKRLDQKISSLSALQISYQSIEEDIPFILRAIPQSPEVGNAVSYIERTAASSNVQMKTLSIAKVDYQKKASKSAELIPINITVIGDDTNIQYFLSQINTLPRLFSVDQIAITKTQNLSSQMVIKTSFLP